MGWTRLDDMYVHYQVWDHVSYAARWQYLSLVQFCSRTHRYNGTIPMTLALGCGGLDPAAVEQAHHDLAAVDLIEVDAESVRVLRMDDYLPPPNMRDESRKQASAKSSQTWRLRKCERGEHSKDCPRVTCPKKQRHEPERDELRDQSRQDGTRQDRLLETEQAELARAPAREVESPWGTQPVAMDQPCIICGGPLAGESRKCAGCRETEREESQRRRGHPPGETLGLGRLDGRCRSCGFHVASQGHGQQCSERTSAVSDYRLPERSTT